MNLELNQKQVINQYLINKMNVTDKDFDEKVINAKLPVLIEFQASWCVPCKMMEYVLNELEDEYEGKVLIAKLNIDRYQNTPKKYNLTGVPTFCTFKDGQLIESKIGAQSKKDLIKMINKTFN